MGRPAITTWEEGFWRHVAKGTEEECWEWKATKDRDGYGQLRSFRRGVMAHRVSWECHFGLPPADKLVLHHCDNPSCVNPWHLFLGTEKDNMHDCLRKGRHTPTLIPQSEIPAIIQYYQDHVGLDLKKNIIYDLAEQYKVSWFTIRGIVSGGNRRNFNG